jgi:hypothetical protein
MSRLSEGDSTVTELAKETALRMPHASAEIRRMRGDQLVTSDLPPGSRGSKIRLTEQGWKVLEGDEWAKVLAIPSLDYDKEGCSLLFRDESNLLLGFLKPPNEPMVQIPNRIPAISDRQKISTRNQGVSWTWAVLSEKSPRWFDLDKMRILDSPPEISGPGRIDSYLGQNSIVGIMRARLLNPEFRSTISLGDWFIPYDSRTPPPLDESTYHRGNWVLGSSHHGTPDIRPTLPVAALIKERLPRSVLLRSARSNSLLVADLGGLDMDGDDYPLEALDYWIEAAHPRLKENERRRRLQSLKDRLSSNRRIKTDDATLRKFRNDWGGASFSSTDSTTRIVELRGLGKTASESLVRWSLDQADIPLVLETTPDLPSDLLSEIASHPNLRLIISSQFNHNFSTFDRLTLDRIRTIPWLNFSTNSGLNIPVRLVEQTSPIRTSIEVQQTTISPWEILGIDVASDFAPEALSGEMVSIISSALSQYPVGDEGWANQMEAMYPLAAWIASPSRSRWPRWQRISNRLDHEWLALLDMDHLPIEKISEIAEMAPNSVLSLFSEKITIKLREDSDNLIKSWPAIDPNQANRGAAWLASKFIQNSPWLPEESHSDILDWAIETWLSEPPMDSMDALIGFSWLLRSTNATETEFNDWITKIRNRAESLPQGHHLRTWSELYDYAINESNKDLETIQRFRTDLPNEWWAPISQRILVDLLVQDSQKDLFSHYTPWCASILRPIGEICEAPGMSTLTHPGCDPTILEKIKDVSGDMFRTSFPEATVAPVLDLLEALESAKLGRPPLAGRTHDLVGWLAQPRDKWPDFTIEATMSGDSSVAERLIIGKSGFHPEMG